MTLTVVAHATAKTRQQQRLQRRKKAPAKTTKPKHRRAAQPRYWVRRYDCQRFCFVLVYNPGRGSTAAEVRRRLGAVYVAGGGYYTWRTPTEARAVDLVVVPGRNADGRIVAYQRVAYRPERRPVVQISKNRLIVAPLTKGQRLDEATTAAFAADYQPRDPARPTWRELIAVKGSQVWLFKFRSATERYCRRVLKHYGFSRVGIAYFDGGRAISRPGYDPSKPLHLAVLARAGPQLSRR